MFFSFHRLPFYFVDCYTEAFKSDIVPFICFCFHGLNYWCDASKFIASKVSVK